MDRELRKRLPLELVEIIMYYIHRLNMEDILTQIRNCITWISCEDQYSFLISNNVNYYKILELCNSDDEID